MWIAILLPAENQLKEGSKKDFRQISSLVVDSYNRHLAKLKVKFPGVKKIAVSLYDFGETDFFRLPIKGIPVITIDRTYDFEHFFSLSKIDKKIEILNLIQTCMKESARQVNQEVDQFDKIKLAIINEDFRNEYIEGKLKLAQNKKYKGGTFVKMYEEYADIFIVFTDREENFIGKRHLIRVRPNRIFIKPLISKSKWKDQGVFEVSDETGQIHFEASIHHERVRLYFTPVNQSEDELIDHILIASARTTKEQVISLLNECISKLK